jgi:hypothetical protein
LLSPSHQRRAIRRPWRLLAACQCLAAAVVQLSAAPEPALSAAPTNSYMRVAQPDTNTVQLQIAIRKLVPAKPGAPVISLVGVSHLGETNYYQALQRRLDAQALVLFEGVRRPDALNDEREPKNASAPRKMEVDETSIQFTMAQSLGLAFQLNIIDYDRPHFRNSDMSLDQIGRVLSGGRAARPANPSTPSLAAPSAQTNQASAEFQILMQVMDGTSAIGRIAGAIVRFLGSSPRLQATTKLMLIELLGNLQGDMTEMGALPPDLKRLLSVLLHARNGVVVHDLKAELQEPSPPATIAVFYGAAHMHDLEKRICEELGYHAAGDEWLPAITVNLPASGLNSADLNAVRSLVKWQMQLLQQPRHETRPKP